MTTDTFTTLRLQATKQAQSTLELRATIDWVDIAPYRESALRSLGSSVTVDGFRKGHVPLDILAKKIGDNALAREMVQQAIPKIYITALEKNPADVIGRPDITLTKCVYGQDCEIVFTVAVFPEISLPAYADIARDTLAQIGDEDTTITPQDVAQSILHIRKMRYRYDLQAKDHNHEEDQECTCHVPELSEIKEEDLPPFDDAYVQELGSFTNVDEFMHKIEENMKQEKQEFIQNKKKSAIVQAVVDASQCELPRVLVDYEIQKLISEREYEIALSGVSFDAYLKSAGITKQEMQEQLRDVASARTKTQLVLQEIAKQESITPDKERVQQELAELQERFKGQKDFNSEYAQSYIESVLLNRAVVDFLETGKK